MYYILGQKLLQYVIPYHLDAVQLVTLSPESRRSCAVFSVPMSLFTANQVDNINAVVLDDTRRVNLGRSISEVFPKGRSIR